MRFRHRRAIAVVLLLAALSACTGRTNAVSTSTASGGGADVAVSQFVAAWQVKQADQIAALTSQPAQATETVTGILTNLQPTTVGITTRDLTVTGNKATVTADYVWNLPKGVIWSYSAQWPLVRNDAGWRIEWSPTLLHPQLGPAQTIALRTTDPTGSQIVDRNNQQLVSPTRVHSVIALKDQITDVPAVAAALEKVLKPLAPSLTAASIVEGVNKSGDGGYTVINLRDADFESVQAALEPIDGLSITSEIRKLPPTKDFARFALAEAVPLAETLMGGAAGWEIVTVDSTGAELETLEEEPATPGKNVVLTLDSTMQQAAEAALADVPEAAMLVAIQPSTGEILTLAQNTPANAQGPLSLMGQYPPGSTFKIVTASAAIDGKLASPSTVVPCPGKFTVDFRPIHNDNDFALGDVTLTTAFAKSCNTTFAQLATELPNDALTNSAKQYGIGLDFVIPGITTLTGQAPVAESQVQKAEDGFGQGVILVTPFSAALMAATVAAGTMPTPTLIRGQRTTVDQQPAPRSAAILAGIPPLMRAVVTEGTATGLQSLGDVFAKTGTADNVDGAKAHAWTVGYRGDVAFAVLIVNGDSSKRTTEIAAKFLAAAP